MRGKVPHIVQYQGSKRSLAPQILQYMPRQFDRLIEPFSGMAAISIAVAYEDRTRKFLINDLNAPLISVLKEVVEHPKRLIENYSLLWNEQFSYRDEHVQHFYEVRNRFNNGEKTPANMLYLLARCVKGSVRYGKNGNFNQSPDKRRHGTNPQTLESNVYKISCLLKGKTEFMSLDYHAILEMAKPGDIVYMDPPYQGVSNVRDNRYLAGVPFLEFAEALKKLSSRGIDYIVSYDGVCGEKAYGEDLPNCLNCKKIMLNAGVSSQAILLGRKYTTFEALYVSESLIPIFNKIPQQLSLMEMMV